MKKLFIISAIAISGLGINAANAQVSVRLGLGLGPVRVVYTGQPVAVEQSPVYDNDADDYYYLPDVDAYYDVTDQCYVYFDGNEWLTAAYLPGAYRDYDWRTARRFEVREHRPYMRADFYRSQYNGHRFSEWARRDNDHFGNVPANRNYRNDDRRFDNRTQVRDEHKQFNVWGQGSYQQPAQRDRNDNRFDNRGQRGYQQPAQRDRNDNRFDNRGQGGNQPSNRNNGNARETKVGDEHYAQNHPQGGLGRHNLAKF